MSTSYSMWPVVLLPYNLPPWKCMKETNFFMSLLISGPKSPGREIDVYLQPLIEELKELWTFGVRTYDSLTCQFFQLYATLLWTINDFPAYGDLSGWSTKAYQAFPICMGDRSSFGDTRIRKERELLIGRRKYFFDLPYWSRLLLRHKLDVMHIEKNVCDNLVGTLLNIEGKTKDTTNAQLDLQDLKRRKDLHLVEVCNRLVKPHASYTLTSSEQVEFCKFMKSVKFPDGFVSNISRCVHEKEITGPVSYNWIYPIERSLSTLKRYVRNKARPEGSIAETYVMNESRTFCSRYLCGIEIQFTRDERNDDTIVEDEVLELRESANLSDDFFSLAMGQSFDVRCYNGCIVGGVRFHTIELDSRRTTQNSRIMIIGKSDASETSDNNFYDDPKNGINWKVVQVIQNKRIWDVPEVEDVQNDHISILEVVVSHQVDDHIEDDTLCRNDVDPTIIERPILRHVTDDFIDDVDEHLSHASDDEL
ncbi:putative transposase [Cucumis melo var. makuwa]|uniref:Putative transposase n=1 Tax=Cucumis melo var. makuwa TaxID=1194695 RepID=A0A5D3BK73_CUCMM|nr:putative transposase [Cucumis melo var. makuwa]